MKNCRNRIKSKGNNQGFFRTSNLSNFVSFQNFLMKFGMHVLLIKQNFLFSLCCHKFSIIKKLLRKNTIFSLFFAFFSIFSDFEHLQLCRFLFDLIEIWYADLSYCILIFSLQCGYQLSKIKKLFKKNH